MKRLTSLSLFIFIMGMVLLSWGKVQAASVRVEVKGSYFQPADSAFKDIYGKGTTYGVEAGLKMGNFFGFWVAAENFSKKGKMTFTLEETSLKIMPLSAGISFEFPFGLATPYLRLGIGYFHYEENNILGQVKKSNVGYMGQAGLMLRIVSPVFIDLFANYSSCKVKPLDLEADLGGLKAGLGVGLQF